MSRDLSALAAQLARGADGNLRKYLHRELVRAGLQGEATARMAATLRMRTRTGRLRSSITSFVTQSPQGLDLHLQAGGGRRPVSYAALQEHGGMVRPRRGQFLAIPLPAAQTAAGALKGRFAVPGGLRGVPGLFLIRSKAGNLLIVQKRGQGFEPLFVLKRQTTVRGKHYLNSGILAAQKALPAAFRESLVRVLS